MKTIQRMLGHASAAMTLDIYAGLFDDDLDDVGERLSDAADAGSADSVRTLLDMDRPPAGSEQSDGLPS